MRNLVAYDLQRLMKWPGLHMPASLCLTRVALWFVQKGLAQLRLVCNAVVFARHLVPATCCEIGSKTAWLLWGVPFLTLLDPKVRFLPHVVKLAKALGWHAPSAVRH